MRSWRLSIFAASAALSLVSAGEAQAGPLSAYYLTAGDQGQNWVVQGAAVVNNWAQANPQEFGEYAIAVTDAVRTLGNGGQGFGGSSHPGSEYTLGGVYTGVDYAYPVPDEAFYDGTSDGTFNYSVSYREGGVYRFNSDWSIPVLLFGTNDGDLGITYDVTNNSVWVSSYLNDTVTNYALDGTVLSSFSTGFGLISSLALDSADDTLWMGSQATLGVFYQFSKAGVLLSTETYAPLFGQNTLGGEFQVRNGVIPEPSAIALAGMGLVGVGLAARRRRIGG